MKHDANQNRTDSREYAERLQLLQGAFWKTLLDVQAPYRWNIRRLIRGTTLDIGCGIGRNLLHLGGNGVGIDRSEHCLAQARLKELTVFSPDEFKTWADQNKILFDNILIAHVLEHMTTDEARVLLNHYTPFLKDNGRLIIITPQQAGYASDSTHITYLDFTKIAELPDKHFFTKDMEYSFPFPRIFGRFFLYNEFISIWRKKVDGFRR